MARVGYLIKRAQTVLHDAMADALGSHDLTVTQFAVLTGLDEEPGLSNADLARRAFVTPPSMHAVLQELERLQLVVSVLIRNTNASSKLNSLRLVGAL